MDAKGIHTWQEGGVTGGILVGSGRIEPLDGQAQHMHPAAHRGQSFSDATDFRTWSFMDPRPPYAAFSFTRIYTLRLSLVNALVATGSRRLA